MTTTESPNFSNNSPEKESLARHKWKLDEVASRFPHHRIEREIADGGMGSVYLAHQLSLDRRVAVKVLRPATAKDDSLVKAFREEARTLARLNHPNILAIHDFGTSNGFLYFIMEYIDGGTLEQILIENRRTSAKKALHYFMQICVGLRHAHEHGVLHQDIKPSNIMINREGIAKLVDFGIAQALGHRSMEQLGFGTREYAAPERFEPNAVVDQRSDIYSLGILLYEMLTGTTPTATAPFASEVSECSKRIDQIIHKCLEFDPENRYQSVDELLQAFQIRPEPSELLKPQARQLSTSRHTKDVESRLDELKTSTRELQVKADHKEWWIAVGIVTIVAILLTILMLTF